MRPSLLLAAAAFVSTPPPALAAPATVPPAKIVSVTQGDQGCPPGSHRDQAAVEKAGGDKRTLASLPCVPDSNAAPTTGTIDGAGVKPLEVQPPGIKPAQLQPPGIKPH